MSIINEICYVLIYMYDIRKTISFDIRYQKNFESAQPIEVEFELDGVVPDGIYGYAIVLTNRLVSMSSDGKRMFDLT